MKPKIQYRFLQGFDDPSISPEQWNDLVTRGSTDAIFLSWQWQKAWWEAFGRGKLLIVKAVENDVPFCIAPLFSDSGMIYFTGSGGSDYLDLIGKVDKADILENILSMAMNQTPGFSGFLFYHVPEFSETHRLLEAISRNKNWYFCNEGEIISPGLELKTFPEKALESIRKKSLVRYENWFRKNGDLVVNHYQKKEDVIPMLELFFKQHIDRWASTPYPSLFLQEKECFFFRRLTELLSETGWLRFTSVEWNKKPIAFHFGFCYHQSFFWYKPCFDITLAKYSPGEVLLRQLLIKAIDEKADVFDFGLGDENFKNRFSTSTIKVNNWRLFPEKKYDDE